MYDYWDKKAQKRYKAIAKWMQHLERDIAGRDILGIQVAVANISALARKWELENKKH